MSEHSTPSDLGDRFATHAVGNQPPALEPYDAWASDLPLREAVAREGGGFAGSDGVQSDLAAYGLRAGGELMALAVDANRFRPQLRSHDRYGHRIDRVEFHPAWHALMQAGVEAGVHAYAWRQPQQPGAHVARAALSYLHHAAEQGSSCPLTMTYAAVPVLQREPAIASDWLPRAIAPEYDPRDVPASAKAGVILGMGMTEKQGGSDVRANTTQARRSGEGYLLVGHKWFFSAPMSDGFLVLAQAPDGLTCFLLPRWLPDGSGRNAIRIQRLKDKCGNWSNASSEVEFEDAFAWRVGEEGRGVPTIIQMVALTRLDCMLGSAAEMRQATVQALHHVRHRSAFGRVLLAQPLMRNVVADLALESEAAVALAMRVARAVDASPDDAHEAALARIATAIGKYWICKRTPTIVNEAQECLGGAGYVEEAPLARLYREAPLNSIWEGCGNIQCLDVLRALAREPEAGAALFAELALAKGLHAAFDRALAALHVELADTDALQVRARRLVEHMALALTASVLLRHGDPAVAGIFCRTRLDGDHGVALGTLPRDAPFNTLVERAFAV